MKEITNILLACVFSFFALEIHAQYDASPSIYTTYFDETVSVGNRPIKKTACDIAKVDNRDANYAIIQMNYQLGSYCGRSASFGIRDGALHTIEKHSNGQFSWDHSGVTKTLFDPRSPNVFYVLYQEAVFNPIAFPGSSRATYLKRFIYSAGSPYLIESGRLKVFDFANGADFVVGSNGRMLICGVDNYGTLRARTAYEMTLEATSYTLSPTAEVKLGTQLSSISMDMKGLNGVLGYSTGTVSLPKVRAFKFSLSTILGTTIIVPGENRYISNHRMRADAYTPKTIALRENGDVFYIRHKFFPTDPDKYDLVKLSAGSIVPSFVFTEAPSAEDLVISEDDKIYVSGMVDGEYAVGLFNEYDNRVTPLGRIASN